VNAIPLCHRYNTVPTDRVLQGFSPAFDASVEEIWMAFFAGAALVPASRDLMRSGPDLPLTLDRLGITVFSTVPTLLSVLSPESCPGIRIIIVGGEACR
jgi:non-ribosomal peptide synthetase component F